jgi:hypothetical protein
VRALAGILAAVLEVIALMPYIRDLVRGEIHPHRGSWAIFAVLGAVGTASQLADGGSWSVFLVATQAVGSGVVFVLAIDRGVGGASRLDLALLALAALGLVGWKVADNPTVATACVVAADTVAVIMMAPKTYRDPWSESLSSFVIGGFATLAAIASVGALDAGLLLYPVAVLLGSGSLTAMIIVRRRALGVRPAPA